MNSIKYCEEILPLVSRTFALGISLLKDPLFIQVNVGYLICRILDSIEDTNEIEPSIRNKILKKAATILCTKDRDELLEEIENTFPEKEFKNDEYDLLRNTNKVMEVFDTFNIEVQNVIKKCVFEMANGMASTVLREKNGRLDYLEDNDDLCKYCYYVAGTVGKLLTGLFILDRQNFSNEIKDKMDKMDVAFGLGLQLTNILKGIYEDNERGVVYLPKTLLKKHDVSIEYILENPEDESSKAIIFSFIEMIMPFLDKAIDYTLIIPETEDDIRMFCALPVLFAFRTLKLAKENPTILLKGEPLKITRKEVKSLHVETSKKVNDNESLKKLFMREKNY